MTEPEAGRRRSRWAVRALVALGVLSAVGATTAAGFDIAGNNSADAPNYNNQPSSSETNTPGLGTAPTTAPSAPQVLPRSGRSHTRSGGS